MTRPRNNPEDGAAKAAALDVRWLRDALHQLCQPLSALECLLFLSQLPRGAEPAVTRETMEEVLTECGRMMSVVRTMQEHLSGEDEDAVPSLRDEGNWPAARVPQRPEREASADLAKKRAPHGWTAGTGDGPENHAAFGGSGKRGRGFANETDGGPGGDALVGARSWRRSRSDGSGGGRAAGGSAARQLAPGS